MLLLWAVVQIIRVAAIVIVRAVVEISRVAAIVIVRVVVEIVRVSAIVRAVVEIIRVAAIVIVGCYGCKGSYSGCCYFEDCYDVKTIVEIIRVFCVCLCFRIVRILGLSILVRCQS